MKILDTKGPHVVIDEGLYEILKRCTFDADLADLSYESDSKNKNLKFVQVRDGRLTATNLYKAFQFYDHRPHWKASSVPIKDGLYFPALSSTGEHFLINTGRSWDQYPDVSSMLQESKVMPGTHIPERFIYNACDEDCPEPDLYHFALQVIGRRAIDRGIMDVLYYMPPDHRTHHLAYNGHVEHWHVMVSGDNWDYHMMPLSKNPAKEEIEFYNNNFKQYPEKDN